MRSNIANAPPRKVCKGVLAVFIGLFMAFGNSFGQSRSSDEKKADKAEVAREVVRLMARNQVNPEVFKARMEAKIDEIVAGNDLPPEASRVLHSVVEEVGRQVTVERLVSMLAHAYEDNFTIGELRAIRDFYSSDAGKALVRNGDKIRKDQEAASKALSEELFTEMDARVKALAEKRRKKD